MKSIAKKYEITPQVLHDDFKEKHGEIPDEWVKQFIEKEEEVQEEVDPNIQGALDVLDKLKRTYEEIEGEEDAEVRKLKREVEQLRKMVHEITRTAAAQGGGGEVRLEFLDDVDRDSAKVDGKVLQYDAQWHLDWWCGGEGSTRFADLSDVDLPETRRHSSSNHQRVVLLEQMLDCPILIWVFSQSWHRHSTAHSTMVMF